MDIVLFHSSKAANMHCWRRRFLLDGNAYPGFFLAFIKQASNCVDRDTYRIKLKFEELSN
jgi:hypothetical protein